MLKLNTMVTYFLRSTRLKIHYSIQTIKQHKYEQPNFVNKRTHPCISCFISATANSFLETNNSKCLWVSEKQYSIFLQSPVLKFEQTTSQKHSILRSFLTTYQTQFCNKQTKSTFYFRFRKNVVYFSNRFYSSQLTTGRGKSHI